MLSGLGALCPKGFKCEMRGFNAKVLEMMDAIVENELGN